MVFKIFYLFLFKSYFIFPENNENFIKFQRMYSPIQKFNFSSKALGLLIRASNLT